MVVIGFFTILGLAIAYTGMRARSVPCDPVCARCGYDLRGYDVPHVCSECGNDLMEVGGVRRNVDRSSRRIVVVGLAVALGPWAMVGFNWAHQRYGYDWEKLRSNADLISLVSKPGGMDRAWIWKELADRLVSGRLSVAQASGLIDTITKQRPPGSQHFSPLQRCDAFVRAADKAGAISPAQFEALAKAFYVRPISLDLPSEIVANEQFHCWPDPLQWELPGLYRVLIPQKIQLLREGAPPVNVMNPSLGSVLAPKVPAGSYQIAFYFHVLLVRGNSSIGVLAPRGTAPVAQWDVSVKEPIEVVTRDRSGNRISPVRTARDLEMRESVKMEPAWELCFADRTVLVVRFKVLNPPENFYFKPVAVIGGRRFSGGSSFFLKGSDSLRDYEVQCELDRERFEEGPITIEFQPDLDRTMKFNWSTAWYKPLRFEKVPMRRRDSKTNFGGGMPTTQSQPRT